MLIGTEATGVDPPVSSDSGSSYCLMKIPIILHKFIKQKPYREWELESMVRTRLIIRFDSDD